jgi:site-specific DNA recombinase
MEKERPKTCLASARISSQQQMAGESLDDQVRAIKNAAQNRGLQILPDGEVETEVVTGTKRRPVYEQHIQYIKENPGKVGYYLIRYIDRFTRGGASVYSDLKKELSDLGVMLIDTNGIIQESRNMPELAELGFEYEWARESPSDMTEVMLATTAKQERDTILKRTIPKQIAYTQKGFQIGRPDDGFVNHRTQVGPQIRFVQIPDPERAIFIRKIFELRAENKHSDQEILRILNEDMGYRSKKFHRWNKRNTEIVGEAGGNKLQIKQLQRIYQRLAYAGVLCEKWTHYKPIKAQWEGLVSIELWNKANRGKIYIKEYEEGLLELLYDYKTEKPVFQRLRHNPEYPFKCVLCPQCGKPFKGSAPRGNSGGHYPRYHCERGHLSFTVTRQQMDETVGKFLDNVEYGEDYLKILEEVLVRKLRQRQRDIVQESKNLNERVLLLKTQQERTLQTLITSESPMVKALLEKELEQLVFDIRKAESIRFSVDLTEDNVAELVSYARKIVEQPKKALVDKENPLRQKQLFKLFFEDLPTYSELDSGTAKKRFLFNKKCVVGTFKNMKNSCKGGYRESNPDDRLHKPGFYH